MLISFSDSFKQILLVRKTWKSSDKMNSYITVSEDLWNAVPKSNSATSIINNSLKERINTRPFSPTQTKIKIKIKIKTNIRTKINTKTITNKDIRINTTTTKAYPHRCRSIIYKKLKNWSKKSQRK